jgi:putative transposase
VEQDYCVVKRIVRPMLGLKAFRFAWITLAGIELVHRPKKGQMAR